MRIDRLCIAGALMVGMLCLAEPASAEIIGFRGLGKHISDLNIRVGTETQTVAAGELNWSWLYGGNGDFYSYCVDAVNSLNILQFVDVEVAGATAKVAWLVNTYAGAIHVGGSAIQAAALQIAVWEALYDSSANLTSGNFRLNTAGDVRNQANLYLTSLYLSDYQSSTATLLNTRFGQDQVVHATPEPSTLLLMACTVFALARRRKTAFI